MNLNKFFYTLLGVSMLMGACTSEEVDPVNVSASAPGVHVRLTGAASPKNHTRATVEAQDGEKTVNSLLAVLFDTHEGFYKTVPASRVGDTDEYTFIVEKDATYDIWLVANASDELRNALESIPEGTKMEDENGVNCLESIIANQPCDADGNFLMVSKYSEKVTTCITETQSIGQVHMIRLSARFDLLNKAEDITVTNINFSNRAIKSALLTPNTMSTTADFYENHDYEVNVKGEPEKGKPWEGYIYSYENHSLSTDVMTPKLTISYYEGTNSSDIKTHEISLIDPNSTAGTTMPIKRNNLYRIVLTKATKLNFDLQVLDWDDEEATFEHPNLSLNLPKNVQDSLNRQLLVYDLFTEYNVKSLNDDGTVTFFDEIPYYGIEGLEDSFYSFKKLKADGKLYSTFTAKDENGQTQKYRIPTFGEAQLLVTHYPSMFPFDYDENLNPYVRLWYDSRLNGNEFTETVYLKNDENGNYKADITDESDGFTGVTELRNSKRESTKVYYNESTLPAYSLTPIDGYKSYTYCPCYGIRFKNTKQCAAYKWELKHTDTEPMNFYLSIKIKALPKDSDITVSDITDNNSYWNKGYLEYNIPIIGERNANSGQMVNIPRAYFITSSMKNSTNYIYFGFYVTSMYITNYNIYNSIGSLPLRLVKVKEPAESTQPAE